jgi:hypothetical protein
MSEVNILAVKIDAVYPHPNADKLDIIIIGAYQTCDAKGKHQIGDIVAHFPPDILIPLKIAADLGITNYLKDAIYPGDAAKTKCRVGAIRLRGVASFGFVLSVKAEVGDDLTDRFHGVKYEPPEHNWCNRGDNAKGDVRFHTYTGIQNYRNPKYHNAILEGMPVRLTEKLHGCLISRTRIRMADGDNKFIRNIQPGEFVVGYKDGQPVPSKVLKVWENGKSDSWLKIQFLRNQAGRGSSVGSITCTPNHQFLQEDGSYKDAQSLKVGDSVNLLRSDWYLSPVQEQVLLGKILGDGCLHPSSANHLIEFGHVNKALVKWICRGLGNLISNKDSTRTSGYGSLINVARTHTSSFISEKFQDFIKDGKKIVPQWVADELTPLAIAFWYMDDGSLGHHQDQEDRAYFAVCGFTKEDCDILIAGLKKYNINAVYYNNGYSRLRLNSEDAERLFLLIAPYIPKELQYKLPERYRGHEGWLPDPGQSYKQAFIWQPITSIMSINKSQQRWDLETETHNYLPSSIVTHNSNSRVGIIDGQYMCGSHTCAKKETFDGEPTRSIYWKPLTDNMKDMLRCIAANGQNVIAFGEIYGSKVQFMDYGVFGSDGYALFDISVNGQYLNWDEVVYYATRFCVPLVPLLYKGPFNHELVNHLVDGQTTIGDLVQMRSKFKGREGLVITPLTESFSDVLGGRLILKAISVDYLECRRSDSH